MRRWLAGIPGWLFLGIMLLGSALITASSIGYFDFDSLPPFVIEKLPVRFEALWLASLRAHVAASAVTFPSCLLLMMRWLQRRAVWHRWLGRAAGFLVLLVLVPSGVVLAFDAKGGLPVTLGFLLSAAIVAVAMLEGVRSARRRDFSAHRRAMRHVVAQMSVAVTSRAVILALNAWGTDPDFAYVLALWGPVLLSAAVAELWSRRVSSLVDAAAVTSVERIRRESFAFAGLVRLRPVVRPVTRLGR